MPYLAHRKCMPQMPVKKTITIPWVSGTWNKMAIQNTEIF